MIFNNNETYESWLGTSRGQDILGDLAAELTGSNWRETIANIHFNSLRGEQILLEDKIRQIIENYDIEQLNKYGNNPSTTKYIEIVIEKDKTNWLSKDRQIITRTCSLLQNCEIEEDIHLKSAWSVLITIVGSEGSWEPLEPVSGSGLAAALNKWESKRIDEPNYIPQLPNVIQAALSKTPVFWESDEDPQKFTKISRYVNGLNSFFTHLNDSLVKHFDRFSINSSSDNYIHVMNRIADKPNLMKRANIMRLGGPAKTVQVVEKFINLIDKSTETGAKFHVAHGPAIQAMLLVDQDFPWTKLVDNKFKSKFQTFLSFHPSTSAGIFWTLVAMTNIDAFQEKASKMIDDNICNEGYQFYYLSKVWNSVMSADSADKDAKAENPDIESIILLVTFLYTPDNFKLPGGPSGKEIENGNKIYLKMRDNSKDYIPQLERVARVMIRLNKVPEFLDSLGVKFVLRNQLGLETLRALINEKTFNLTDEVQGYMIRVTDEITKQYDNEFFHWIHYKLSNCRKLLLDVKPEVRSNFIDKLKEKMNQQDSGDETKDILRQIIKLFEDLISEK